MPHQRVGSSKLGITHLQAEDLPDLSALSHGRGSPLREGIRPPFASKWRPTVALCLLVPTDLSDSALREWLHHHMCAARLHVIHPSFS
jgi:hypothetical protein